MKSIKFETELEIPLRRLQDLIIAAVEGGSNYWYEFREKATAILLEYKGVYDPEIHGGLKDLFYSTLSEAILVAVADGKTIPIHDIESDDKEPIGNLSYDSIKVGIQKMQQDNRPEMAFILTNDGDYDAGDADVIFQYLTLGDLVYG